MSAVPVAGPVASPRGRAGATQKHFPFVAATSTSPSHNLQLNLQAVMSQRRMRRSPTAASPRPTGCSPRGPASAGPTPPRRRAHPGPSPAPAAPCPLLGGDLSDADSSCGDASVGSASSCSSVELDRRDGGLDKLAPQCRWEAGPLAGSRAPGRPSRCRCYPRHVAEYVHVLKPFLRRAADEQAPPPSGETRRPEAPAVTVPKVEGPLVEVGGPREHPRILAAETTLVEGRQVCDPQPRDSEQRLAGGLAELRAVLVALRRELVALGAARDQERQRGPAGAERARGLEEGLQRKEAEVRVIVDLYRQVQLLRTEVSCIRRSDPDAART
ncbi:translation initiation factor IF-2-like [Frankliniella occidentalis]|uniref:Translation initiation factor IF-2-like n=1 Tax=Frankliniella occidentalis TaxID=133901 RepID=A0A9C6TQ05_FRAOC|nr:translation initiation factor IF-2-like [Frankliniella occidentalis]